MCWAAVSMGLQVVGAVAGQLGQESAIREQQKTAQQQIQNTIKSANFSFQNYELERQDEFDKAVQEITKTRMNAMQLNAGVEAAVNEDYAGGGRTADLINRSAKGDEMRSISSIKDNYDRKSSEIDQNKEATLLNEQATVAGIKPPKQSSRLGMALQIGSAVAGYKNNQENIAMYKKVHGVN